MARGLMAAVCALIVGVIGAAVSGAEAPRCPVMPDELAVPEQSVEYEGRRVYLCCQRCRILFTNDPEKYASALADVGQAEEVDWETVQISGRGGSIGAAPNVAPGSRRQSGGVMEIVGRSHVVWVHFPIACLVIAGVIRLGALIGMEGTKKGIGTSGLLLLIGAASAVVSAGTGLIHPSGETFEGMTGVLHETFERHKLLGLVLAGGSVVAVMIEVWSVGKKGDGGRHAAHAAVVLCGALAVIVAHLGGTLVHGPGFLLP